MYKKMALMCPGHNVYKNNTENLGSFGFELGIPHRATATFKDRGIVGADITNDADFLTDYSYGVFMEMRTLGKVNVGLYLEFAWNLFDKFFTQTIDAKSYNLSVGLTLGWSPNAIMLKK